MNILLHMIILAVLFVALLAFFYYRYKLTAWEDDSIHIHEGEENIVANQEMLARKMGKVDLIAKIFTAVVVIYAIVVGAVYSYLQLPQ